MNGVADKAVRRIIRALVHPQPESLPRPAHALLERLAPVSYRKYAFSPIPDLSASLLYGLGPLLFLNPSVSNPAHARTSLDHRDLLEEAQHRLQTIKDPQTGQVIFSTIYKASELYSGPFLDEGPDLVLDYYRSDWGLDFNPNYASERWFMPNHGEWYGDHSKDGIFTFWGKDFSKKDHVGEATLEDIPATILYLMGVAIPEDYDGRVLTELIAPERLQRQEIRYQPGDEEAADTAHAALSREEEAAILDQLRALGYVD